MNSIVCPLKSSVSATILALGMLAVQPAFATDDTWVGNTSINWATAANWNPAAVPVAGDDLLFGLAGTAGANLTNDIAAGTFFTGITFNSGASAFTFFGNSIGITSGMTNSSGVTQTISNNIVLGGNATVDTEAGGTTILASLISGNFGLTNNGAGTLILATNTTFGANGSTFTGGVTVNAGTLQISQPPQGGKTCLGSGPLTVNAGAMVTDNADGYGYGSGSVPTIYVNGGAINSYKGTYPNICFVNGGTIKVFGAFGTLNGNGSACGITNLPSGATAIMGADPSAAAGTWNNTKPLTLSVAQGTVTGGPYPGVDMLFSATLRHSGLVFKTGNGTLEMSGANSGVTGFTISNGTVVISGSLPSSCMVTNAGGALCGSNSISGSVTDVSSAAQINQETNYLITGAAGTLTIGGNLDMSAGGDCSLDLVTSAASGNDSIAVGGALVLGSGTVFHLKALGGSANLAAADYVLIQGSSPPSGSVNPAPAWDGTVPANAGGYSVQISGNNVILRPNYVPLVTSAAAAPSPATNGENVLLTVVVTNGTPLYNVTVNASAIGASSSVALALQGSGVTPGVGYVYTNTVAVATTNAGNYLLPINVTDSASYTVSNNVPLTVAVYLTWNGDAGGNSKWDTAGELEWRNGLVYGQEDTVRFDDTATGLNATNVNLEAALSPAGVVVSNTAGTPTGIYTFNDGTGAGGGSIIGSGGVIKQGSGELLMAEGSDGFSNGIVVGGGTLIYS
ncbi:MAG: autotransporter-associated beta strand repeat-containing protein, partial [Verrucomicrobia bacterium]|nr:autotransporter-associated beta strand repeat-containing protein [Verrucomicrobiota bacterium]